MTRKDYILIADALRTVIGSLDNPERRGAVLAAGELAHVLKADNPRFETIRFLKACGLEVAA